MKLTEAEMITAAKKVMKILFPNQTGVDIDKYYTPYFVAYCIEVGAHAVDTTAKIKYFQVIWQAGANPAKFKELLQLWQIVELLYQAAKEGIMAIAKGEISILARAGFQYSSIGTDVRFYFNMGGGKENYPTWPKFP